MNEVRLTEWAQKLGLTASIVCAPMGGVAGGALATAVSRAGGLGTIGMGSTGSRAALERQLAELGRDVGGPDGLPFGIGMVDWVMSRDPEMLDLALAAHPKLISVSFGDWSVGSVVPEWIERVQRVGGLAVTQVATPEEAKRAAGAGVDAVVARGREGGGHGDHREARDVLLERVLRAVEIPVLSAGAVASAEDLSRVLDAGAAAAWVGTAFAACDEALTSSKARDVLLRSSGADTVVTRVADIALGQAWPERFPERVVRTAFTDEWTGHETGLAESAEAIRMFRAAAASGDVAVVPVNAGQGVGSITRIRPARDVVADLR